MTRIVVPAADGAVQIMANVSGVGRPLIMLPGGIDYTGRGWDKVLRRLAQHHRVVRFVRRFYRPELGDPFRWDMTDEAADVAALARHLGGSVDLIGHSSGGVLALECLVRAPDLYGSAVVFEAPIVVRRPLGGAALTRARAELDRGHPGRAMATFLREVVGLSPRSAWLAGASLAVVPGYRRRVPGQLADLAAIDALGDRRSAYRTVSQPVLGISGTTSPAHLTQRMHDLVEVLPRAEPWQVDGGHAAAQQHPREVADRIADFLSARPTADP